MNEHIAVQAVDSAEVTIIVDNFMDVLLPSAPGVQRAAVRPDSFR